ncbi:hypothetical protein EDD94_4147 [Streptomyces sp. PanSC9]|nr:hypothetical protein EDD94_4147 [Streptomyces sp. PanSC9]
MTPRPLLLTCPRRGSHRAATATSARERPTRRARRRGQEARDAETPAPHSPPERVAPRGHRHVRKRTTHPASAATRAGGSGRRDLRPRTRPPGVTDRPPPRPPADDLPGRGADAGRGREAPSSRAPNSATSTPPHTPYARTAKGRTASRRAAARLKQPRSSLGRPPRAPRACLLDHARVAGRGTRICGVVVGCRRTVSPPSSALQLHAPRPARVGGQGTVGQAGLVRTTGPSRRPGPGRGGPLSRPRSPAG